MSGQARFVLQWVQYQNKAINGEDEYDIIQLCYWQVEDGWQDSLQSACALDLSVKECPQDDLVDDPAESKNNNKTFEEETR